MSAPPISGIGVLTWPVTFPEKSCGVMPVLASPLIGS